jgi:hypothetical protein
MRRIILHMMLSLDGLIAGPNDDLSWHIVDEDWNRRAIEGGVFYQPVWPPDRHARPFTQWPLQLMLHESLVHRHNNA